MPNYPVTVTMKLVQTLLTLLLVVFSTTRADYPEPLQISGNMDQVHDPSMSHSPDGQTYYVVSSGVGIPIRHGSADKMNWVYVGEVFPAGIPWCYPYSGNSDVAWAPDISYHPDRPNGEDPYVMYYACSTSGSPHSAIFLATSKTGLPGEWNHKGLIIATGTEPVLYNAIDPNLIVDPRTGDWWLDFGSYWTGIKIVKLNKDTGLLSDMDRTVYSIASRSPESGTTAVEAAFIYYHEDAFYLFVSWDRCCAGLDSNYRVMVGRSESITGPYVDRGGIPMQDNGGGTEVVATHGNDVHGPGHQAVMKDPNTGEDLLIYHYYYANLPWPAAKLGLNNLGWDDRRFPYMKPW